MNLTLSPQPAPARPVFSLDYLADSLATQGYCIARNFLNQDQSEQLYQYARSLSDAQWQLASVGRQQQQTINTAVRSDRIFWLDEDSAQTQWFAQRMSELRTELNRNLFLGLFDYECHLAKYPAGAFYKKHLDAFKGRSNRVLTTVLYLNPHWQAADGGELVIYGERGQVLEEVLPLRGTLVTFLSDRFVHEVKVAHKERYSLTGWFRHNTSISGIIDPPR